MFYQALSGFGRDVGGGIADWAKKHAEMAQQLGQSDTIVSHALKTGGMTPDQYTEYLGANASKKEGIAAGIAKNMALDQAAQFHQEDLANAIKVAQIHAAVAGAGAYAGLSPRGGAPYGQNVGDILYHPETGAAIGTMGERGPVFFPSQAMDTGADQGGVISSPLLDAEKKPVPGKVVVTKPGSNAFSIQDTAMMPPEVQLDPTGNFYNTKTGPKPVPTKTARRLQTQGQELAVPTDTGGIRSYLPTWLGGTPNPTPTPAPLPPAVGLQTPGAQAPAPFAPNFAVPAPTAGAARPPLSPQDQQALNWAKANPNDPRAAAIVQKLGISY